MSSTLAFELWLRRPASPGPFAKGLLGRARALGLRYGGLYYDQAIAEEPPGFYSKPDDRNSWEQDFLHGLGVSQRQGWGQMLFDFSLRTGEDWSLHLYVGPGLRWMAPDVTNPDLLKPTSQPVTLGELRDSRWWLVQVLCGLSHLRDGTNMEGFLANQVIPLCTEVNPVFGFGDVLEWGKLHMPSALELEEETPNGMCWFNFYGPGSVARLGGPDAFSAARQRKPWRIDAQDDGGVVIVVTPTPELDDRQWGLEVFGLSRVLRRTGELP